MITGFSPYSSIDSLVIEGRDVLNVTPRQIAIVRAVIATGGGALFVSAPTLQQGVASWAQGSDHHGIGSKHYPGIAVDFVHPDGLHPDVMRTFLALSKTWKGGVGLGLPSSIVGQGAAAHLHVDARATGRAMFIELGPIDASGKVPTVSPGKSYAGKPWAWWLDVAKKRYGYTDSMAFDGNGASSMSIIGYVLTGALLGAGYGYMQRKGDGSRFDSYVPMALYGALGAGLGWGMGSVMGAVQSATGAVGKLTDKIPKF